VGGEQCPVVTLIRLISPVVAVAGVSHRRP
jgi:hypothetical protein